MIYRKIQEGFWTGQKRFAADLCPHLNSRPEDTRFAALCDAGHAKRVSRTPVSRLLRTEKRP